jgi:putative sterol carrier protein
MSNSNFMEKMTSRFNKEAAENLQATYLFEIEGEGEYTLKIENQSFQISPETTDNPNVTLKADKGTWESIVSGQTPAQMAFMMGKLNVKGDLPLALKLANLFNLS